jgi:hypothetical protein
MVSDGLLSDTQDIIVSVSDVDDNPPAPTPGPDPTPAPTPGPDPTPVPSPEPNPIPDTDGDGIPDSAEAGLDSDSDGIPNNLDLDDDNDNVDSSIEALVPSLGSVDGATGDGNGDGIADTLQAAVTSVVFHVTDHASQEPGAEATYVTLVADSMDGDGGAASITHIEQLDAPDNLPAGLDLPLGLISFTANVENVGETETFSLYVDGDLQINGYWKQAADGDWVNLASEEYGGAIISEAGRTRLDFQITDGGQFDDDGIANGIIVDPGAPGYMDIVTAADPVTLSVSSTDNLTRLDSFDALAAAPATPSALVLPYGHFSATAITTDASQTSRFQLKAEQSSNINGIWVYSKDGLWVNLAESLEVLEDGSVEIDFSLQDNGIFDQNDSVGTIEIIGTPGTQPMTILGSVPVVENGGSWF